MFWRITYNSCGILVAVLNVVELTVSFFSESVRQAGLFTDQAYFECPVFFLGGLCAYRHTPAVVRSDAT